MVEKREELARRFEELIARLFRAHDIEVVAKEPSTSRQADIVLRGRGRVVVGELKLYRSFRLSTETIEQALLQLEATRRTFQAVTGIFVTNVRVEIPEESIRSRWPHLRLIDFDRLYALASIDPELINEFDDLNRQTLVFRGGDLPTPDRSISAPELGTFFYDTFEEVLGLPPAPPGRGRQLCNALRAVPEGDGPAFEIACENAVRFLFADDLTAWDDQHHTDTSLHRFDLIARVASKQDFWEALVRDFRARYVIFEFKNYKTKLGQGQVYTTEKYLYPVATRAATIIVSRLGADEGAQKAMRGALREMGKLILSLTVNDICLMLEAKDQGNDHLELLVEKLDGMLMSLER